MLFMEELLRILALITFLIEISPFESRIFRKNSQLLKNQ
jgi:hypothetical protein